jgi:hypothetical protein
MQILFSTSYSLTSIQATFSSCVINTGLGFKDGGTLVESEVGNESSFYFSLPITKPQDKTYILEEVQELISASFGIKKFISKRSSMSIGYQSISIRRN